MPDSAWELEASVRSAARFFGDGYADLIEDPMGRWIATDALAE